jgi:hypothetical protein
MLAPGQRAVLGLLAVPAGSPVRLEAIVDVLWGEAPPYVCGKHRADVRQQAPAPAWCGAERALKLYNAAQTGPR